MTISQAQQDIILKLDKLDLTNPQLEADILLSYILKKPSEWLLAHPEFQVNSLQIINHKLKIRRRLKGESLAYILGHKYFYGYKFIVNKHVLVPRPETEMMVDIAREQRTKNKEQTIFVDVGTGSGCIIIALAKKLKYGKFIAVDISKKALKVAKENARLHSLENKISFLHGNLLSPIINNKSITNHQSPITICANLPYLTPIQLKNSPSIQAEPKNALVGGFDGLKYYRELFKQLKLLPNKNITVLCEIDPSQSKAISKLIKEKLPECKFEIKKDLRGLERLVILKK